MSDDTVMVQPVRTFLEGAELVHPESEPYRVSRSRMLELRRNGLVVHLEGEPAPVAPESRASTAPASEVLADPAPPVAPADPASPRRRGRPPGRRG